MGWDFALTDNNSPAGTTYCFRAVKSDGNAINTYTQYPEITTAAGGGAYTPTTDDVMRHGNSFNGGTEQGFSWAD